MTRPQCQAKVWERDTYRYTGRVKGGFEMHYKWRQCLRPAMNGGTLCWQHENQRQAAEDRKEASAWSPPDASMYFP